MVNQLVMIEQASKKKSSNGLGAIVAILLVIGIIFGVIFYFVTKPLHYELSATNGGMAVFDFELGIKAFSNGEEYSVSYSSCVSLQKMSLKFGDWFGKNSSFCDDVGVDMWGTFKKEKNGELSMKLYSKGHVASYTFDEDFKYLERYSFGNNGVKPSDAVPILIESKSMEELRNNLNNLKKYY